MSKKSKLSSISKYFTWLLKQYHELKQQSQQDTFRIIEIKEQKNGSYQFMIQIIGKRIRFKSSPEELAADDNMMQRFSRHDVRTITFFACQERKKPKYKILMKEFCSTFNKMVFSFGKRGSNTVTQKTAAQIAKDTDVIKNISPEEAYVIGFTLAAEKNQLDESQRKALHDKKVPKYKITQQDFSDSYDTTIYTLEEKTTKQKKQKDIKSIVKDKKLLKGLDQKEAFSVGFAAGMKQKGLGYGKKEDSTNNN